MMQASSPPPVIKCREVPSTSPFPTQTPTQRRDGTVVVCAIFPLLSPKKEITLLHLLEGILVLKLYGHVDLGVCACTYVCCVCVCVHVCVHAAMSTYAFLWCLVQFFVIADVDRPIVGIHTHASVTSM